MTLNNGKPTNLSLLSPNRNKVVIPKFPGVEFFSQNVPIPAIKMGETQLYTNQSVDYWTPGDKVVFEELRITFLMDEDFVAFNQIKDWLIEAVTQELKEERYSDLEILILTNNLNKNKSIKFKNTFPVSLTSLDLSTKRGEDEPLTVDVVFKYSDFEIS